MNTKPRRFNPFSYLMGTKAAGGGGVTVEPISITENGVKTAPAGKAYSPVTVNVPTPSADLTIEATGTRPGNFNTLRLTTQIPKLTLIATYDGNSDLNCSGVLSYMDNILELEFQSTKAPKQINDAFRDCGTVQKIIISKSLSACSNASYFCFRAKTLKEIAGQSLDFSSITSATNTFGQCTALETVRFVPSSILQNLDFHMSTHLTNDSLVSIANGLNENVTAKTLTLGSSLNTRCGQIVGTVTDDLFTIDAGGSTTLTDFITNTKGWTLA